MGVRGGTDLFCGIYGKGLSWVGGPGQFLQPPQPGPAQCSTLNLVSHAGRGCSGLQEEWLRPGPGSFAPWAARGRGGLEPRLRWRGPGQASGGNAGEGAWPPAPTGHTPAPRADHFQSRWRWQGECASRRALCSVCVRDLWRGVGPGWRAGDGVGAS